MLDVSVEINPAGVYRSQYCDRCNRLRYGADSEQRREPRRHLPLEVSEAICLAPDDLTVASQGNRKPRDLLPRHKRSERLIELCDGSCRLDLRRRNAWLWTRS